MNEHRVTVPRRARYYTLGRPGRAVWFVLHGYGQLASRFLEQCAGLDDGTRLIVAPEALSRFYLDRATRAVGASWMTREDRLAEIADYVECLDAVYQDVLAAGAAGRERTTVDVLGFSQGAPTAVRWLARGEARADRLIVWGGEIPPDLDLTGGETAARLRRLDLVLVAGHDDPYLTDKILARDGARLGAADIPFRVVRFAGGHALDGATLAALSGPPAARS